MFVGDSGTAKTVTIYS
jgi:dynein heavy chain